MTSELSDLNTHWTGSSAWYRKTFNADTNVVIDPPVRLKEYIVEGKLRLSLKAYLDLVIANNTDISVQRLTLQLPKNAIERAFAIFDPSIIASFAATSSTNPASNALEGAAVVKSLSQPFNLRYQQLTPFSTTVFSTLNWTKNSNNNAFQLFNPAYQNNWQLGFTQPLMRNRGRYITKLPITIARAQKVQQDTSFQDTLLRLLVTAESAYWDVVSARERLRVQREALKLAQASLDRTRLEIKLGATSELEVYQPEQNAASAQISVTQFEYLLRQSEDSLRRQMGADLDPDTRTIPIELTEDVSKKPDPVQYDREKLVELALTKRPDLLAARIGLEVNDLQIRSAQEGLRPLLNFQGTYNTFGRGGPGAIGQVARPGGPGDAWAQLFAFDYPTYAFSLNLTLPLRDRAANMALADSVVNKRLNTLRRVSIEQTIRQDVLNAITNVESSREGVRLAEIALDYAQKRADADQKRYDLGVITIFFLLSAQNDLTTAQSNLVTQTVSYRRNVLTLQQRLGTLLDDKGIVIQ